MLRVLILLIVLILLVPAASAQQSDIYLIKLFDCAHKPVERSQTGFRVRGIKGLVTALHGVAGCKKITATNKEGPMLEQPLTIKKIDIDHDMVILSSAEFDKENDGGLEVAGDLVWESLGTVKVYGHPYGISSLERTLLVSNPALKPLKDLVPAVPLSILIERRSPNHLIKVLNLQGNLLPGHSGAPIIDARGRVIAVANGGLKGGFAGISWAIPFKEIDWDGGNWVERLKALARRDPHVLFAVDALVEETTPGIGDDLCERLFQVIKASETGFTSIVDKPVLETFMGVFRSKIELPGALFSGVTPNESARFAMSQTNMVAIGQSEFYGLLTKMENCLPGWERIDESKISTYYMAYWFRENERSPIVHISYNLDVDPHPLTKKHTLFLTVSVSSDSMKRLWKSKTKSG